MDKVIPGQATDHSSGDDDDCGSCSPFFNCDGCAVSVVSREHISFDIQKPENKINYSSFSQAFISYNFSFIWQPPQLV